MIEGPRDYRRRLKCDPVLVAIILGLLSQYPTAGLVVNLKPGE